MERWRSEIGLGTGIIIGLIGLVVKIAGLVSFKVFLGILCLGVVVQLIIYAGGK